MILFLFCLTAFFAGGVASIAGFGIGSILTPVLGLEIDIRTAVAAVSIPHMAGTALRLYRLRASIDAEVFQSFGVTSAVGGLTGALLHNVFHAPALAGVFAALLLFAGGMGLSRHAGRLRFGASGAWFAGLFSGLLGGLVGNQGGIRSAALLGFPLKREAFVATATAIALIVDAARIPVYVATTWSELLRIWPLVAALTLAVVAGTLGGEQILRRIPERAFRVCVSLLLVALGIGMALRAAGTGG